MPAHHDASRARLRVQSTLDELRSSFFFLPAGFVVVAVIAAEVLVGIDSRIDPSTLPRWARATPDSGRNLLGAVAAATITVAATVFSVTMVAVQLASSQFSPRVLRGFLRDRFQQVVMGQLVATFTYSLLVLRSIRAVGEGGAEPVVPNISVLVGLVLAGTSVLAILAYIDHTARNIQVVEIIRRVSDETVAVIREHTGGSWPDPPTTGPLPAPPADAVAVRSARSGWIQQTSPAAMAHILPVGTTLRLQVRVGEFVAEGQQVALVWPAPADPGCAVAAFHRGTDLGSSRTMQQDISFGIRQLADISLRALSPAVNDPTTAYEVVVHLRRVLIELLPRDLPPLVRSHGGRTIELGHQLDHDGYVTRAFSQIRAAAAPHAVLVAEIIRTIGVVVREMEARGMEHRTPALHREAHHLLAGAHRLCAEEDRALLVAAAEEAGLTGDL